MRRVLIIDDEADIREVASLALELMAGWRVVTAASGAQGLAAAQSEPPDAILLDVRMPGMDGPSTFQRLQESGGLSSIPVVFLTAKAQAAEQRQLAAIGAAGVLAKPFDPLTLSEDLSRVLGWSLPTSPELQAGITGSQSSMHVEQVDGCASPSDRKRPAALLQTIRPGQGIRVVALTQTSSRPDVKVGGSPAVPTHHRS